MNTVNGPQQTTYDEEESLDEIKPRPLSRLTYRILSFNLLVVLIIAMGVSYLGTTRQNLITSQLDNFENESYLYGAYISQMLAAGSSIESKDFQDSMSVLTSKDNQKFVIYDLEGTVIYTVGKLPPRAGFVRTSEEETSYAEALLLYIDGLFSVTFHLPPLPEDTSDDAALSLLEKNYNFYNIKIASWSSEDGGLVLTSYVPLIHNDIPVGGLRVFRRDIEVEDNFAETRMEIMRFLVLAMVMTIAHSLYLASLIGHPLRILATAAEAYRLNRSKHVEIPDLSDRQDEIGELSHSMREMANSLQKRLSTIEQFAADVSHEIKNPLTSLRSALETLPRVRNDEDRDMLMQVALHDLQRLDRLISDISQASRLDAELSRNELLPIDLRNIIFPLINAHKDPMSRLEKQSGQSDRVICEGLDEPIMIMGQAGRLEQVFQNLIGNALSFAPEGTQVRVTVQNGSDRVKITVDDQGPGIPENKLEKVFDRFYSERPVTESFGMHSGLGLSIAKQIVSAHNGTITAENRKDSSGKTLGARFSVRLKTAAEYNL
ncbi:MAG: ATP-binding protein [Pseudobdellovibrionaceae bacterium]|jgi:two-component system sensor histidine kinase ChvG|nr:ATP-binding protein [Pseudobdellovibrionaceae bacterium]